MARCKLQWLDAVAVVAFVLIGRRSHDQESTLAGLVDTATPFLLALVAAWLLLARWRPPTDPLQGLATALITVVIGMVLRNVAFDGGTATSFVVVATAFLVATMTGWRLVLRALDRRRVSA